LNALETRLAEVLWRTPGLMQVLKTARDLALPDWMIMSGAVYQPVWNHLTGRPLDFGLKDYDLAYFDATDLSYETEDRVIRRVAAAFASPLRAQVEARNQARVHLWFESRFGAPYAPLACSAEALARFLAPAFAVGVRLEPGDGFTIFAPFGLDDLFAMRLRPNRAWPSGNLSRVAESLSSRWPELTIIG